MNGVIAGYDPGGNGANGLALLFISDGLITSVESETVETAHDVLDCLLEFDDLLGIGVDTLTEWSTGKSGWRHADLTLRAKYPLVQKSVTPPNSLFGSMALNGMSILIKLKQLNPNIPITEAHPKVLFHALTGSKYNYAEERAEMDRLLSNWFRVPNIKTESGHEWDALISAYSAYQGMIGNWTMDLHTPTQGESSKSVNPIGKTHFYWPSTLDTE